MEKVVFPWTIVPIAELHTSFLFSAVAVSAENLDSEMCKANLAQACSRTDWKWYNFCNVSVTKRLREKDAFAPVDPGGPHLAPKIFSKTCCFQAI